MDEGVVNFNTAAARTVDNAGLEAFLIPATRLVQGLNSIAVEAHQVNRTSSDLVMGLALTAQFLPASELTITNQPSDLEVEELKSATLSVGVAGNGARYQWYKNAELLSGATRPFFFIPSAMESDTGVYHVVVSNAFSLLESRRAQLTVIQDTTGPALLAADGTRSNTVVVATFSEPITPATAGAVANYTLTNTSGGTLTISSAVLTNGTNVILTSQARLPEQNYLLFVRNIRDIIPAGNLIGPNNVAPVTSLLELSSTTDTWDFYDPVPPFDPPITDTAWRGFGYDPVAEGWGSGPGAFVFDLNNQELPAQRGTVLSQGALTKYFRKRFEFTGSPAGASLRLRHLVDDGAIIYLNGEEVVRFNMPSTNPIDGDTPAPATVGVASFVEVDVDTQRLRFGDNLLAVELHGRAINDQDWVFGLEQRARIESYAIGPVVITRQPQDKTVTENQPATFTFAGAGAGRFQWFRNGSAIVGATNAVLNIDPTPLAFSNSTIRVTAQNNSSSQTSSNALLTVLPDGQGPRLLSALGNLSQVTVIFDERLNLASATSLANYSITNATGQPRAITGILLTNATNVVLTTSTPVELNDMLLVRDVTDDAGTPNPIATTLVRIGFNGLLLDFADVWRYDESGNDLGTAWRTPAFNDSTWLSGPGLLGAETATLPAPLRTLLTPPNSGGPITYYFRTQFNYPGDPANVMLTLRQVIDDAVSLYLNGQELYRVAVPLNQDATTVATRTVGDAVLEGPISLAAPSLLRGNNLLAAEVHQVNNTSSDIVMGAQLSVPPLASVVSTVVAVQPAIEILRLPDGRVSISWTPAGATLFEASTPNGTWSPVSNPANPYLVQPTQPSQFYQAGQ